MSSVESMAVYSTEMDFARRMFKPRSGDVTPARRWHQHHHYNITDSWCRRNLCSNFLFLKAVTFLIGLGFGIVIAYLSLDVGAVATTSKENVIIGVGGDYSSYDGAASRNGSTRTLDQEDVVNLKDSGYPTESSVRQSEYEYAANRSGFYVDTDASGKSNFIYRMTYNKKRLRDKTRRRKYPLDEVSINDTSVESVVKKTPVEILKSVYWTEAVENLVPKGFADSDIESWRRFLNDTRALKIEEGCGRMQNRLVIFDGGDKSCCRYRHNNDQIQGEIFSFYLGRLLNLSNLLPSALELVKPRDPKWFHVSSQVAMAQWNPDHPVVLTKFISGLHPEYIPKQLRSKKTRRLHPGDVEDGDDLSQLVQWSDLIVFDYLTANLDRIVNNMFNERWNADMMNHPTHNLARTDDGLLVFLDNESGLLHGYRLLGKYEHFHKSLLESLCVFRKRTAEAVRGLRGRDDVDAMLRRSFSDSDPGMEEWLPFLPEKSVKILKERISTVDDHIRACEAKYARSTTVR